MEKFQAGSGSDTSEIIIDYKKKGVQILDPEKRFKLKNTDLDFSMSPTFCVAIVVIIPFIFYIIMAEDIPIIFPMLIFESIITAYLIFVILTPIRKKYHQLGQFLFNDFFKIKKIMIVKDIKTKVWKLPYDFKNIKLDYILEGDYAKYISKVHIQPKDYFLKRWGEKEKQVDEWECLFYFSKIPIKGKMIIEWI